MKSSGVKLYGVRRLHGHAATYRGRNSKLLFKLADSSALHTKLAVELVRRIERVRAARVGPVRGERDLLRSALDRSVGPVWS